MFDLLILILSVFVNFDGDKNILFVILENAVTPVLSESETIVCEIDSLS